MVEVTRRLHRSRVLRGNPLGDPHEREVYAIRPRGAPGPLPAVLFLAGFTGSTWSFLNRRWRRPSLPERLARLWSEGCPAFCAVVPDVVTATGGSQYLDSPAVGPYATWLLDELMPWAEEAFGLDGRWGVAGRSSGGYGALALPARSPGRFVAAAAHSPDAGFEYAYVPDFPRAAEVLRDLGGLAGWWEAFRAGDPRAEDHAAVNVVGMACVYSPRGDGAGPPPACELPFDPATGAVREEVFARWLEHDPVRFAARRPAGLAALAGLWLDVGRRDEFRLQVGARLLRAALRAVGVEPAYEEHDGGHFDLSGRFDRSIPWLAGVLVGAGPR